MPVTKPENGNYTLYSVENQTHSVKTLVFFRTARHSHLHMVALFVWISSTPNAEAPITSISLLLGLSNPRRSGRTQIKPQGPTSYFESEGKQQASSGLPNLFPNHAYTITPAVVCTRSDVPDYLRMMLQIRSISSVERSAYNGSVSTRSARNLATVVLSAPAVGSS